MLRLFGHDVESRRNDSIIAVSETVTPFPLLREGARLETIVVGIEKVDEVHVAVDSCWLMGASSFDLLLPVARTMRIILDKIPKQLHRLTSHRSTSSLIDGNKSLRLVGIRHATCRKHTIDKFKRCKKLGDFSPNFCFIEP